MLKIVRFILAVVVAALLGLSSHIFLLKFFTPIVGNFYEGYNFPQPDQYSHKIVFFAYLTSIEQVLVTAMVYYFVSDLIKANKLIKIFIFSVILLELHGNLIRMPLMNAILAYTVGVKHFILAACLTQLNQWVSTFLLVGVLVCFCPFKKNVRCLEG